MVVNFFKNGKILFLRRQSNILSAAAVITLAYGLSMLLGIVRDRLLVARFYACCRGDLDSYWAAFRLPDFVFQLLVIGALSAAFIPVFGEYLEKDKKEAYRVSSSAINIVFSVFLVLSLLVFIFARPLSELITGGFTKVQLDQMANLTRIMILAQFFFLASNFLTGVIQSHQRFLIPALSPVVYNLGIILGILVLSPFFGIYGPALGVVLGAIFHLLIQVPLALRLGFVFHPFTFDFDHPGVREIARLMTPRALSLGIGQIEATVSLFLATSLAAGSLTIFYLAQHLMRLPVRLVGVPIGQAALPLLAKKRGKDLDQFKEVFLSSFWQILYLVLPATAILLILRIPAVRIAFGARGFPWKATILTGKTLAFFTLAIIAQAVIQLLVRAFYALHNTKTPLLISLFSVCVNVALSVWFIFRLSWGILGLAVATSVASFLQAILLFIFLDRAVGGFERRKITIPALKMGGVTFLTAFTLWVLMRFLDRFVLDTTRTINLIILTIVVTLVGLLVYIFLSRLFKIPELEVFLTLTRKIGRWQEILSESEEIIEPQVRSVESP